MSTPLSQIVLRTLIVVAVLARSAVASASPITWQYNLLVHGTAITGPPFEQITIPFGTPMIVQVEFDTDTPNVCGTDAAGIYAIGSVNSNSATVDFLGYRYGATGGMEVNVLFTTCSPLNAGGVRLFVHQQPLEQLDPNATAIQWQWGQFGILFLPAPPTRFLGAAWPDGVPPQQGSWGGISSTIAGGQPQLQFDSIQLQLVPEPHTLLLLASGVVVLVVVRRRWLARREPRSVSAEAKAN